MTETTERATREAFFPPPLPSAEAPSTEDIAMMLADARARAHELIDQSVARAKEMLERRQPAVDEAATNAQREAQRLALERLRRSVAEIHSDIRALHARLDGIEGLLRQRREPDTSTSAANSGGTPTATARPSAAAASTAAPSASKAAAPAAKSTAPSATTAPAASTTDSAAPTARPTMPARSESERTSTSNTASSTATTGSTATPARDERAEDAAKQEASSDAGTSSATATPDAVAAVRAERTERSSEERAALAAGARASLATATDEDDAKAETSGGAKSEDAERAGTSTAATASAPTDARSEATSAAASTAATSDAERTAEQHAEPATATPSEAAARATSAETSEPPVEQAHRRIEDAVATALTAARNAAIAAAKPALPSSLAGSGRDRETSNLDESTEAPPASSATTTRTPASVGSGARNELQSAAPAEPRTSEASKEQTSSSSTGATSTSAASTPSAARSEAPASARPAGLWTPPTVAPPTPAQPRAEAPAEVASSEATQKKDESEAARDASSEAVERTVAASALRQESERRSPLTPTPRPFTPVTPPSGSATPTVERVVEPASQGLPRFATPVQSGSERATEEAEATSPRTSAPPASLRPNPPTLTPPRGHSDAPPAETYVPGKAAEALTREEPASEAAESSSKSTAFPGGGAIVVRVSPISGFQGLMRVQDAIANLREVREAAVEAYARGEAQLRVALVDELAPERLTKALSDGLGQDAKVEAASVDERTMRVTLA
ncbi:MAG: hypothetical protein R3C39_08060 [Dehalococcoidia bacterium]